MKNTDIIEALRSKLSVPGGRHLYGVLGSYAALAAFSGKLRQAKAPDGRRFPRQISVNRGILNTIPDNLRSKLRGKGLIVLSNLETLFAYNLELNLLRTMAADADRILLLLPGRRSSGKIIMFPNPDEGSYTLPTNLIADNHLWEVRE